MKSNWEKNLKNALEKYEMPYNENAWSNLSKKLDNTPNLVVPKKFNPTSLKWIMGGIALIGTVATIVTLSTNDNSSNNLDEKIVANKHEQVVFQHNKTQIPSTNEAVSLNNTIQNVEKFEVENNDNPSLHSQIQKNNIAKVIQNNNVNTSEERNNEANSEKKSNNTPQEFFMDDVIEGVLKSNITIEFPEITSMCEDQKKDIKNNNSFPLIIQTPNGKEIKIESGKIFTFQATEIGEHIIKSAINKEYKSFIVNEAPKLDFSINNEIQYENGLPALMLQTHSEANKFEWTFGQQFKKQYGNKTVARFYKKGNYDISLKGTNANGCISKIVKNISIEKDYNLLAPSGFMPLSDDSRKNKFIPIALTLRNVAFKMYIIEARNGAIIFETNSIEGWDGMDKNTRQLVEPNSSYIWKVVLENPEPNEPREYTGVVVRL